MRMVMTVMAVALHLFATLREDPIACQMFCLRAARGEAENGAVRARTKWTALAIAKGT